MFNQVQIREVQIQKPLAATEPWWKNGLPGFDRLCRKLRREGQPPVLVLLVGLPGSGKSYLARDLSRMIPALVVESDAIRKRLFHSPRYTPSEHGAVHGTARRLMLETLQRGVSTVDDATNLTKTNRKPVYRLAEMFQVPLIIVQVTAPEELIQQRLAVRAATPGEWSDATWEIYERLRRTQQPIRRPHLTVETSTGYQAGLDRVMALIRRKQRERENQGDRQEDRGAVHP